jgi:hypothetical protein
MPSGTVTLHRVLRAPAERIYRAFLDPDAMAKWLPPHGFTGKVHHLDRACGGSYRMSLHQFQQWQYACFRRPVPGTGAQRAHPAYRRLRRSQFAGHDGDHHRIARRVMRHGCAYRAGGHPRGDPDRGLLSRLAGIRCCCWPNWSSRKSPTRRRGDQLANPRVADESETEPVSSACVSRAASRHCAGSRGGKRVSPS